MGRTSHTQLWETGVQAIVQCRRQDSKYALLCNRDDDIKVLPGLQVQRGVQQSQPDPETPREQGFVEKFMNTYGFVRWICMHTHQSHGLGLWLPPVMSVPQYESLTL
jgi:hypothetical protein